MEARATTVRWQPLDISARLAALGLREEDLRESALFGMRHALMCTRHEPPNVPGVIAWGKIIRFLRDRLVPLGWQSNNVRNYATVVKPDGTIALAVAAGDAWTGKHGLNQHPSTRSAKGPATREAVGVNIQLRFEDISASFPPARPVSGAATWLLLFYWDESVEEIRVELSFPKEMNQQGYVTAWVERIILTPIPLSSVPTEAHQPDSGDDDVNIDIQEIGG
jgi:hypothetical protein